MKKFAGIVGAGLIFVSVSITVCMADITEPQKVQVVAALEQALKEKTAKTGTLDLYDESENKVRNLRLMEANKEIFVSEGGYYVLSNYRDINSGAIVQVEFKLTEGDVGLTLDESRIKNIQKLAAVEAQVDKEYTDQEIQDFMRSYISKQTKFTDGKLMLFDEDNQKMRNLLLKDIKAEVRRMGIFYSSTAQFVDADSGDLLTMDISVEKQKGALKIQALRIRNVVKGGGGHSAP